MTRKPFDPSDQWQLFELIPSEYFAKQKAHQTIYVWFAFIAALMALLAVLTSVGLRKQYVQAHQHATRAANAISGDIQAPGAAKGDSLRLNEVALVEPRGAANASLQRTGTDDPMRSVVARAERWRSNPSFVAMARELDQLLAKLMERSGTELTVHSLDFQNPHSWTEDPFEEDAAPSLVTLSISIRGQHAIDAWCRDMRDEPTIKQVEVVASATIRDETLYTITIVPAGDSP